MSDPDSLVPFLKLLLFYSGIAIDDEHRTYQIYHTILFTTICLVNISGCIVAYVNSVSYKTSAISLMWILYHTIIVIEFYMVKMMKRKHCKALREYYESDNAKHIGKETEQLVWRYIKSESLYYGIFILCGFSFYAILSLLKNDDEKVDDLYDYVMPLWFSCGGGADGTSKVKCLRIRTDRELKVWNVVQSIVLLYEQTFMIFSGIGAYVVVITLKAKAITLKSNIEAMERNTDEITKVVDYKKNKKNKHGFCGIGRQRILKYDTEVWNEFRNVFIAQQQIEAMMTELNSLMKELLPCNVFLFFFLALLYGSGIYEKNTDIVFKLKSVYSCFVVIVTHYKMCSYINHIYEVREIIIESLYNFPWFQQSVKFKKSFIISMILSQPNVEVKVHNVYVINLSYFAENINRLYSALGFMRLKYSNSN